MNAELTPKHLSLSQLTDHAALADLLLDEQWGLIRATKMPGLHEVCLGLGEHYAAIARGTGSSKGLINLLPMLLQEAMDELKARHADAHEHKVLLAVKLIFAAPKSGERGLRLARKGWARAWGRRADLPVSLLA